MAKLYVAFLWHHHQPYYGDIRTGRCTLPWVRLHGIASYIGMARLLQEVPEMRATFNLVPSLVEQIQGYAAGQSRDEWLILTEKPAEALEEREVEFVLQHFFSAKRETLIQPHRRYDELFHKRSMPTSQAREVIGEFSAQDLRDLQVWASLAWFHPIVVSYDRTLRELIDKGSQYTEDDKAALLAKQREVMGQIVPLYRHLQDEGQAELTTSPYYHPILPLLCNMASAREALPNVKLPEADLPAETDAEAQVRRGIDAYQECFGCAPRGLWPSEGSVSPRTLDLLHKAGIQWTASDSDILTRSHLNDGAPSPYEPYAVAAGAGEINMVFRDHELSDQIGFQYHHQSSQKAVADFVDRLEHIAASTDTGGPPLVSIILDGENPWQQYANQGVEFLRELYQTIVRHPHIEPTTFERFLEEHQPTRRIGRVFSGSWIYHCFSTWIGNEETNAAWELLARARDTLEQRDREGTQSQAQLAQAREALYTAEGSDWFWWYGEDHSSPYDAQFDAGFRHHLKALYEALGEEPPAELDIPIHKPDRPLHTDPVQLLDVQVDGAEGNYFEWVGAGLYEVEKDAGAMQRVSGRAFSRVHFGFDLKHLFLRVDIELELLASGEAGSALCFEFIRPAKSSYFVSLPSVPHTPTAAVKRGDGGKSLASAAGGKIVEVSIPFDELRCQEGSPLDFYVTFTSAGEIVQQAPDSAPIRVFRPTEDFERIVWLV